MPKYQLKGGPGFTFSLARRELALLHLRHTPLL